MLLYNPSHVSGQLCAKTAQSSYLTWQLIISVPIQPKGSMTLQQTSAAPKPSNLSIIQPFHTEASHYHTATATYRCNKAVSRLVLIAHNKNSLHSRHSSVHTFRRLFCCFSSQQTPSCAHLASVLFWGHSLTPGPDSCPNKNHLCCTFAPNVSCSRLQYNSAAPQVRKLT